jgi:hypothetical protein
MDVTMKIATWFSMLIVLCVHPVLAQPEELPAEELLVPILLPPLELGDDLSLVPDAEVLQMPRMQILGVGEPPPPHFVDPDQDDIFFDERVLPAN